MNKDPDAGVWVLTDDRAGNRTQAVGLAEALGVSYQIKELRFGLLSRLHNLILGASAAVLTRASRAQVTPPWPQLVIAAGRRAAPVARWIKRQSGRRTLIVQLGRKGGHDPRPFDAVVTPVHAALPAHEKRIETLAPLNRASDETLRAAADVADPFGGGPKPHVALLVGGATARQHFGADEAERLGTEVLAAVRAGTEEGPGGTLVAVTSPRTGAAATEALVAALGDGGRVFPWRPNDLANPYLACLARADIIVVTGDSESMIAEATATGKAVYLFPFPARRRGWWLRLGAHVAAAAAQKRAGQSSLVTGLCAYLVERGLVRPPRDLDLMHSALVSMEYVKYFDGTLSDRPPPSRFLETEHVTSSLRAMLSLSGLDWVC